MPANASETRTIVRMTAPVIGAHFSNSRADNASACWRGPSLRRPSRTPSRGMDSARKIPPGREPWPSIARTRNSRSSRHPVGSSRTMNRRRRRCWSKTFRPARVTQERSFAWLPPRQSGPCRANIAQADSAVLILCREKGGALSHGDGIVSTRLRRNIGKSSGACGEMVSPADVPASYDLNSLICPSRTKAAFEHKRQFPQLSSRVPRRGFPTKRTVTTKQAEARDTA